MKILTSETQRRLSSNGMAEFAAPKPPKNWPLELSPEAYHGIAGEFVRLIEPHTESDPAALLVQFLVAFGNTVGDSARIVVDANHHPARLFTVLVGETAKGRKGTAWANIRKVFKEVDPDWMNNRVTGGLSSGEGIVFHVRDYVERNGKIEDEGVQDKRLLLIESEFCSVLHVSKRQGNTISTVIRDAWDGGVLRTLTKNSPHKATNPHISLIGHITRDELIKNLGAIPMSNGLANRFLWVCVRRTKYLPEGGTPDENALKDLAIRLRDIVERAKIRQELKKDRAATELWSAAYMGLTHGKPGLLGAVTSRAEPIILRLALIYALLDDSEAISEQHIQAALAVWRYADASAQYIFGDSLGNPIADRLLRELRERVDEGMSRTDIRNYFQRNSCSRDIEFALDDLERYGLIRCVRVTQEGPGRPEERWFANIVTTKTTELDFGR